MDQKIESLKEQYTIHRKNLTDLNIEKAHHVLDVPPYLNRQIEHEENELKCVGGEIRRANELLVQEVNEIRTQIITVLTEYDKLSSSMSEFESMFLTQVLLPGSRLQLTVQKRKFLEREYNRIREAFEQGMYINPQEIENDIRQTLKHVEVAYAYEEKGQADEDLKARTPAAVLESPEPDTVIDETRGEKLVRDFKRIVIHGTHPDTSKAPREAFDSAMKILERRDYLLMEALIIQYRDPTPKLEEDPVDSLNTLITYSQEYPSVLENLEKRLETLKGDITSQGLKNPEEIEMQMKRQNREIRKAINEEAEQILSLRSCLEDLVQIQS